MAHFELSLPAAGQVTPLEPGRCYVLRLPAHATHAQAAQVSADLRAALVRLPPEQRPVVWLAQGGLDVEDVTKGEDGGPLCTMIPEPCDVILHAGAGARVAALFAEARALAVLAAHDVTVVGNDVRVVVTPQMDEAQCKDAYDRALHQRDERRV